MKNIFVTELITTSTYTTNTTKQSDTLLHHIKNQVMPTVDKETYGVQFNYTW